MRRLKPRAEKTDPFIAVVAAMCIEGELPEYYGGDLPNIGVHTY